VYIVFIHICFCGARNRQNPQNPRTQGSQEVGTERPDFAAVVSLCELVDKICHCLSPMSSNYKVNNFECDFRAVMRWSCDEAWNWLNVWTRKARNGRMYRRSSLVQRDRYYTVWSSSN